MPAGELVGEERGVEIGQRLAEIPRHGERGRAVMRSFGVHRLDLVREVLRDDAALDLEAGGGSPVSTVKARGRIVNF
ncbi:MAG: hypothetical protein R3B70_13025 [Polyangiaceae bacterium]